MSISDKDKRSLDTNDIFYNILLIEKEDIRIVSKDIPFLSDLCFSVDSLYSWSYPKYYI